jgi:hyaluronan synthase
MIFSLSAAGLMWLKVTADSPEVLWLGVYGFTAITYLLAKLLAAFRYRPYNTTAPALTAAVVVPAYNEDPVMLRRCLDSILNQTRPFDEIYIIDDGSASVTCAELATDMLRGHPGAHVHRFVDNRGKRAAQGWAFRRLTSDIVVTVDSDTVLDRDCLAEGLRPLADPAIQAVCGNVRVLNDKQNLLTRLIDLRYSNAFLYERAAYTVADSMLCATGVLTFWRSAVIAKNLDDYLSQRFLGIEVSYGDDRRLTNYALQQGRVVFQETARAKTLAPTRLSHFLRQQVRWNKSFFRETLYALRTLPRNRPVWWFAVGELSLWMFFSAAMLAALAIRPWLTGQFAVFYYLGFLTLMAYARSAKHRTSRFTTFLLAPAYALLHIVMLTPIRLYSLATLRDGTWGTRRGGIEVLAVET